MKFSLPSLKSEARRVEKSTTVEREEPISFHEFLKDFWPTFEGDKFADDWHIKVICDELECAAYLRRDGVRAEINIEVPPGSGKSSVISIAFNAWVWTWWPQSVWIVATFDQGLVLKFATKFRKIINSDEYQKHWPIHLDKSKESLIVNNHLGERQSTTVGGTVTGSHCHFKICDDLIKEQDSRSGSQQVIGRAMKKAESYMFSTLETREKDENTCSIHVGQRLHTKDVAARCRKEGYKTLCFPAFHVPSRADPLDQRTKKGEILCPSRKSVKSWKRTCARLLLNADAQVQQNPSAAGGKILKPDFLSHRYKLLPPEIRRTINEKSIGEGQQWVSSWDFTFKGEESSDYVVGQVWCLYKGNLYLIDMDTDHADFLDSLAMVKNQRDKYPFILDFIFEQGANADAIWNSITLEIPGAQVVPHGGGCLARTQNSLVVWANGAVWLPSDKKFMYENEDNGDPGFVQEHLDFTGIDGDRDDKVSSSSQAIVYLCSDGSSGSMSEAMRNLDMTKFNLDLDATMFNNII